MGNLLNDHPIVGVLALIAGVWAMGILTALIFFMFLNPTAGASTALGGGIPAVFGLALLNMRKLKGVE